MTKSFLGRDADKGVRPPEKVLEREEKVDDDDEEEGGEFRVWSGGYAISPA